MTTQDVFVQMLLIVIVALFLDITKHYVLKKNPKTYVRYILVIIDFIVFGIIADILFLYGNDVFALLSTGMGLYSMTFLHPKRILKFK